MLDTLKEAGKSIRKEFNRAWENLAEGWREVLSRSNDALTHFAHHKDENPEQQTGVAPLPRWGLIVSEVEETEGEILVRVEVPGLSKDDVQVVIEGNRLSLSGEKRFQRESRDSTYHIMERAYGSFQRVIPLPGNVDADKAKAGYADGVLTVRLPKVGGGDAKSVPVK